MINGDEILLSSVYSFLCQGIKISHTGTGKITRYLSNWSGLKVCYLCTDIAVKGGSGAWFENSVRESFNFPNE